MKTLLRWAGGKRRFLNWIAETVDINFDEVGTVYEPFAGSAALFFDIGRPGVINDFNRDLMNFYQWVAEDYIGLRAQITTLMNNAEYYDIRITYNSAIKSNNRTSRIQAARFYFLNRKGFNGIYRVNSKGLYNVPAGSPSEYIPSIEHMRMASELLAQSEIRSGNYLDAIEGAMPGDLVYFDPPYYPDVSSKFNTYTDPIFGVAENIHLLHVASELKNNGVNVMISNSAAPELLNIVDQIPNLQYVMKETKRNINPRATNKTRFKEVVIF